MKFGTLTQIGPLQGQITKIFNFSKKNKMAAVVIFKTTQIAISQQGIDRSSRNLA